MLTNEIIKVITSIQNIIIVLMADSMTVNMKMGMNALRCASISGLINLYNIPVAAYFAARQFGFEGEIQTLVNELYPYLCTCKKDALLLESYMGSSASNSAYFETCTESDE